MRGLNKGDRGPTCPDEEDMVHLFSHLDSVDGNLCVAHVAFEQERLAADHAVHQEVVFDKIQDFIWDVQRGEDALLSGFICDALWDTPNPFVTFM